MKLERTIDAWRACDPEAMATKQSPVAITFAFKDAKHDILALHAEVEQLRTAIEVRGDADRAEALKPTRPGLQVQRTNYGMNSDIAYVTRSGEVAIITANNHSNLRSVAAQLRKMADLIEADNP